jgi:hypothetical protein
MGGHSEKTAVATRCDAAKVLNWAERSEKVRVTPSSQVANFAIKAKLVEHMETWKVSGTGKI